MPDLEHFPLLENDLEVNIYDEDGYRIPRRNGIATRRSTRLGLLMDLRNIGMLFSGPDFERAMERAVLGGRLKYEIYPQAFLGSLGHFQVKGIVSGFETILRRVNTQVGAPRDHGEMRDLELFGSEPEDEQSDDDEQPAQHRSTVRAVTAIACQGYNEMVHRMRGNGGQQHDAQLGLITAALAGTYATNPKATTTRDQFHKTCSVNLPHERFQLKIQTDDINRDFRLENIFCIDVRKLRPSAREGS